MNQLKRLTSLMILTMIMMYACSSDREVSEQQVIVKPKKVSTMAVVPSIIAQKLNITGVVRPSKKIDVVAQVQGLAKVTNPPFKDGIRFNRGQVLVAIDDTEFRSNLIAQKSQFVSSLVRIMSDLKIDYPSDFEVWQRYLDELDINKKLSPLPVVENKQLRYFLSANGIFNSYYAIKSQEQQLSEYRIYAPFDGVVTGDKFDVGSLVSPGINLGSFIHTDEYEILATVSIADLSSIQAKREVAFVSKETNQQWVATLSRISEQVDASSQSVNVYFVASGKGLKEGMYLEAVLELSSFDEAVELPKELLTRNNQVFVLSDSLIKTKPVEALAYTSATVILQGLKEGDLVINEPMKSTLHGTKAIAN